MLDTFSVALTGVHPRAFDVHRGSFSNGNTSTGSALVNATNIRQAYLFCHKKQFAKSLYGVGIVNMHFYKFDGTLEMDWGLDNLRKFMTDREWAKVEYQRRVDEINAKNEYFKW
jgi:hypothetical protein